VRKAYSGDPASFTQAVKAVRILVAEDSALNFELVRDLLEGAGYEVAWAQDGEVALEMALDGGYQLLLLDLHMPRRDGISVMQELRRRASHMPVAAVTADVMPGVKEELESAGVDAFLTKPLDLGLLMMTVRRLVPAPEPA